MKQNVSGPAAIGVLVVALILFAALFSRPAPPAQELSKPLPPEPPVEGNQDVRQQQGLSPLGVGAVFPPIVEDRRKGVRIWMVVPNSPAERAGLQPADLVVSVSGKRVAASADLIRWLDSADPKQIYPVEVIRAGKTLKLSVTGITPLPPEERPRP